MILALRSKHIIILTCIALRSYTIVNPTQKNRLRPGRCAPSTMCMIQSIERWKKLPQHDLLDGENFPGMPGNIYIVGGSKMRWCDGGDRGGVHSPHRQRCSAGGGARGHHCERFSSSPHHTGHGTDRQQTEVRIIPILLPAKYKKLPRADGKQQ